MTWFKVDDSFHAHPKVMATDPASLGLWVVAGSWCSANLTDGFVPDYVLPRLLPGASKLASKLVAAGLWVRIENGHRFHGWLDYNPDAESEKRRRADNARRQAEYRERNASRDASRNGVTNAAPSRPVPSLLNSPRGERPVSDRARDERPPERCPQHGNDDRPPPCGACADARKAAQRWDTDTHAAVKAAVRGCRLCDGDGWRFEPGRRVPLTPFVRCTHERLQAVS